MASAIEGSSLVLSRPGYHDRVPGIWLPGKGAPVVVVSAGGAEAARQTLEVRRLEAEGRFLHLLDVFQTGSAKASRDRSGDWFLSYNRTDDAHRVQDILTALAFAEAQQRGRPRLVALGGAELWCLFAAAVAPAKLDLDAAPRGFEGTDEEFRDKFDVPGVQQAGGIRAALRLTAVFRSAASEAPVRADASPAQADRPAFRGE